MATGPSVKSMAFLRPRSSLCFEVQSLYCPTLCTRSRRNGSRQLARVTTAAGFSWSLLCASDATRDSCGRSARASCTKRRWSTMKKKLPRFKSDKEAEEFVEKADLTEYDLSGMRPIHFEFQPKSERVNMRLPPQLLDAVRTSAAKAGIPYQRFIRQALEEAVQRK